MNRFASFQDVELDMLKKALFSLRHTHLHLASKEVPNSANFIAWVLEADWAEEMVQEINCDPRIRDKRKGAVAS